MSRKLLTIIGFAVAMVLMGSTARANTITYTQGTYTATLDVTSGSATLTFSGDLTSLYTDQVGIHISGATFTGGSVYSNGIDVSSDWMIQTGNNSVNCDGSGTWFCAKSTTGESFNNLTFTWNFTGGDLTSPISVQFAVCTSTATCYPGTSNFVTNFSQSASVPEPGTLSLLGVGLIALLGFGHRFFA